MKQKILLFTATALAAAAFVFQGTANSSDQPELRILKFEADWCGPCQQMKPVFSKVSKNLNSEARFESINVDKQPDLASQYNVRGLPTVIAIKNGKEVGRSLGYMNQFRLSGFVQKHL